MSVSSRALVMLADGATPSVQAVEILDPGPGEVRVRMVASGVCGTDGHIVDGTATLKRFPAVLGHEGAGIVEAVGAGVTALSEGDHVVFNHIAPCGECRPCRRGDGASCSGAGYVNDLLGVQPDGHPRNRFQGEEIFPLYGGTFSEFQTLRAEQLVRIDPSVPLELFCVVGCGVSTGLGAVLNTARVAAGDTVLVVGAGGVGLSIVQGARIAGAEPIIAVDPVPAKRDLAGKLGATHTLGVDEPLVEAVQAIVPGGVEFAFEAVGSPDLLAQCLLATRTGGTAVMVGAPPAGANITVHAYSLLSNRRLVGCRGGNLLPQRDLPAMATLYLEGRLLLDDLVSHRIPLDDVMSAISGLGGPEAGRTVVTFPQSTTPATSEKEATSCSSTT